MAPLDTENLHREIAEFKEKSVIKSIKPPKSSKKFNFPYPKNPKKPLKMAIKAAILSIPGIGWLIRFIYHLMRLPRLVARVNGELQRLSEYTNDLANRIDTSRELIRQEISQVKKDLESDANLHLQVLSQRMDHKVSSLTDYSVREIGVIQDRIEILQSEFKNLVIGRIVDKDSSTAIKNTPIIINKKMTEDELYHHFENNFRGTYEEVKEKQRSYLPFIRQIKLDFQEYPVLDIGCGRGEWLDLLREEKINALGVDINRYCVDQNKLKGLNVHHKDALSYLENLPDQSLGGITGFHIVEHIPFRDLLRLFVECRRVIAPRGFLLFETPNPENIFVGSCDFYLDPTHLNPIPPQTLAFFVSNSGFPFFRIKKMSPDNNVKIDERFPPDLQTILARFNVERDYGIIASGDGELAWK